MRSAVFASFGLSAALIAVTAVGSVPAQAAGCGGYVNVWVSGCAPWDNNPRRLPGAPGYVAPQPVRAGIVNQPPRPTIVQPNALISNNRGRLISDNGAILRNNRFISDQGGGLRR